MYKMWTNVCLCLAIAGAACSSPERGPIPIIAGDANWGDATVHEWPERAATATKEPSAIVEPEAKVFEPPRRGDLVINEVMVNPHAVPDHLGEYLELKNLAGHTVGLTGLILRDDGADFHIVEGQHSIPEGGLFVMARSSDEEKNGGVKADYAYGGSFALANSADEVILDYEETTIDEVEYDSTWSMPNGAALELDPVLADPSCNDIEDLWCKAETSMPGGDTGSPGVENRGCE